MKLIEEMKLPAVTALVIDDYHMIDNPAVSRFIELLAENETHNLHIILTARFTKVQRLEELELKGYLHHITKKPSSLHRRKS